MQRSHTMNHARGFQSNWRADSRINAPLPNVVQQIDEGRKRFHCTVSNKKFSPSHVSMALKKIREEFASGHNPLFFDKNKLIHLLSNSFVNAPLLFTNGNELAPHYYFYQFHTGKNHSNNRFHPFPKSDNGEPSGLFEVKMFTYYIIVDNQNSAVAIMYKMVGKPRGAYGYYINNELVAEITGSEKLCSIVLQPNH
ncbi:unnamed protein product [Blumeria hordei]|uniref:Uncharacterized protein n=1 Tax=Blumeria hordei TaxID=2867405 RepID=A0A383UNY8_BLUHO|nr:unnamed protein product [Blumeria hordei]